MMASVFRKTVTKPFPEGAEIFTRKGGQFARWKDRKGKTRTAPLTTGRDGSARIVVEAKTYTAKFRDGEGIVREVSTGCRDITAAKGKLAELERRAELVKGNVLSRTEAEVANHQRTPLAQHVDDYIAYLTPRANRDRVKSTKSRILECATACRWQRLGDMTADGLQAYLDERITAGMSLGSANGRIEVWRAFGFWLAGKRMNNKRAVFNGSKRITSNPFAGMATYDERKDCRRKRRALTEDEMSRLLRVARRRPVDDAMTIRRGPNKGKRLAKVSDGRRAELELLGYERALIYKTLVLTGLRKNELASICESQVYVDHDPPYLDLKPADEKNDEGNDIVLRADLAADIRDWLLLKAERRKPHNATNTGHILAIGSDGEPARYNQPLFDVPAGLLRILDRDLKAASISKMDERGRTIDLHAMRHTFGTWLSKSGVSPRTAQSAMRHSDIDLTMQVYTDPKLLDVQGAVESLPQLPLSGSTEGDVHAATGTDDALPHSDCREFAPEFAPNSHNQVQTVSTQDKCDVLVDPAQETKKARNQRDSRAFRESGRAELRRT